MKNLKQLETELTMCEQVSEAVQYQVTGGKCKAHAAQADDKRRERPGSNIGNRENGGSRRHHTHVDATKG
ncbi:MAG: hypothetical protein RL757_2270 [Bacteroidota bacterium]|jgi:hypothetical protein